MRKILLAGLSAVMILGASISAYAQSYSPYWEAQADGSWKYKLSSGGYASGWIQDEVDHNWYFMDSNGIMQSGVQKSYSKLYILSELHDGAYGHLVHDGESYNGIVIQASTNADDEGALTTSTINALRNAGLNVDNVPDISGSQHVSNGVVTNANNGQQSSGGTQQQVSDSNQGRRVPKSGNVGDPTGYDPEAAARMDLR